jgi:hemerythrin-like domain-containing protein
MTTIIGGSLDREGSLCMLRIGKQPEHGFDEPLGLLSDCHRRIEHFLHVLVALVGQAQGGALNAAERSQLEGALTYFTIAAPKHTTDEEESLFPRLEASGGAAAMSALELVRRLERDHAEAGAHHASVDGLGRKWLADDRLSEAEVRQLQQHLGRLQNLYGPHIAAEDGEVFPAAAHTLSAEEIRAIGREMAARRGVPWPPTRY